MVRNLSYLLIILLFITACGTVEPEVPPANNINSVEPATEEASQPEETADATALDDEEGEIEDEEGEIEEVVEEEETAVSPPPSSAPINPNFTPATTTAEAAIIRSSDWVEGATEPTVTIVEYGDYQ